jgi:hypothetical protein
MLAPPGTGLRITVYKGDEVQWTARGLSTGARSVLDYGIHFAGSQHSYVRIFAFFPDGSHCSTANYAKK